MTTLLSFGSNGSGQLGLDHKEDVSSPSLVVTHHPRSTFPSSFAQIAAGGNHTLLLFTNHWVLFSGDFYEGDVNPFFTPLGLPDGFSTPITSIAATWSASLLATPSKIWSHGTGPKGELGLGPGITSAPPFQLIPNFPPPDTKIASLAASMSHAVALLDNGQVYGWGAGRKGQLGPEQTPAVFSPILISCPFPVVKALCGKEFTLLLGDPSTGEFLILGSDKFGIKSNAPSDLKNWRDAGAGWGSVVVLKEDGSLVSWGRDDHCQLAPSDIGPVEKIAVGSEHALALTKDGKVLAWGWGEHGNCGPLEEKKGRVNVIRIPEEYNLGDQEITALGGGCATSWIAFEKKK
ncbi:regulator of chromosome condensation 1/beta-lactamase-inhibitor protein II [Apiosordaria backusii]|uniref:Regulator of chromosome condensation 1/beta-lactamase-inhibitor protein II n=1 Tax=Apiosordaria backusii TaxID=314023 RepID=A0AA40BMA7_9PEZI|nr:regulator of chromosome condensation 1/beta-lactamase-inhibitor protein II [Apiosordaria backusii]